MHSDKLFACAIVFGFAFLSIGQDADADTIIDYPVVSEVIVKGTSNGFQNEITADGVVNTKTEANNGTAARLVLPLGDVSVEWDYIGPAGSGFTNHTQALTQTGEPDGNTSYVTSLTESPGDADDEDVYSVSNPNLATGTVITSVAAFIWMRENVSQAGEYPRVDFSIEEGASRCGPEQVSTVVAWINYTLVCTNSYDADAWTVADFIGMELHVIVTTTEVSSLVSMTSAGIIVTYQLPYMLDIDSHITIPSEQVEKVSVYLSCTIGGDSETLSLQIQGFTVATGLCTAPYVDSVYDVDYRGDIVVRMYSNPDATQSVWSVDLLVARVTKTDQGGSLKHPVPVCNYDVLAHSFRCKDAQDYGSLIVQWIRWSLDGSQTLRAEPNGIVWLRDTDTGFGQARHVITAVAVYASGAEVAASVSVVCDNSLWLVIAIAMIVVVILLLLGGRSMLKKGRKKR